MFYKFLEINERTYKRTKEVLCNILVNPTIKLANFASMNDPNEMKFQFRLGPAKYFKEDWTRRNPTKSMKEFDVWFEKIKSERPRSARTEFVLYRRELFKIASLSLSHKSNLLWSHYSGGKHGFCVVYRESILENLKKHQWISGKVIYKKTPPIVRMPEIDNVNELKKVCFTKENCWQYEREYRIAIINGEKGSVFLPIRQKDIFGVILGINANDKFRRSVAEICKSCGYKLFEVFNYHRGYSLPAVEIKNPDQRLLVTKF